MVTNQTGYLYIWDFYYVYINCKIIPLQLHIEFQNVQNVSFRNYLSYIMLEDEKNMWQKSENWKFVGSSQQLLK